VRKQARPTGVSDIGGGGSRGWWMFDSGIFRAYPNKRQMSLLFCHWGCHRWVYNWARDEAEEYYQKTGKAISYRELQDRLVHREKKRHSWLREVNSQSLLAALKDFYTAYQRFLRKEAGFPQRKSKKNGQYSFHCPQHVGLDPDDRWVNLPKIGKVKTRLHRRLTGKVKTCTIKKQPSEKVTISIKTDDGLPPPPKMPIVAAQTTGVDFGLKEFCVTSNGTRRGAPRFARKFSEKLTKHQRMKSRKKRGSKNRKKAVVREAKVHEKIRYCRNHFAHETSNLLLSENQATTVAFEDLNEKGMLKNKKLARSISDAAWAQTRRYVEYKAERTGKNVIYCPRFAPSSKQCPCGYKNKNLTLAMREWQCPECLQIHDRDLLAANNIKKFALAEAFGRSVCVKSSPHSDTCQRKCCGERPGSLNSGGSQETLGHGVPDAPSKLSGPKGPDI